MNLLNNVFPRIGIDKRITEHKFCLKAQEVDQLWDRIVETASPARRLCDMFWLSMPWDRLASELHRVNVLEIGCGTGVYGQLLKNCLGECFKQYVGVDIEANEQWKEKSIDHHFIFEVGKARDAHKFLPESNLILTQSALEHFQEDLLYFRQVSNYVLNSEKPVLQVHLIPSASCLTTFPWHGVREYTPRTISRITRLFDEKTNVYLFALGDLQCNKIHRKFITWPNLSRGVDLRDAENAKYRQSLKRAMLADFRSPVNKPAFYALVLVSNFADDPFMTDSVHGHSMSRPVSN